MKLPRDLDAAQLIKLLTRIGYRVIRQSGSHIRLHCDEPVHSLTIPKHSPLRIGTLASILADIAGKRDIGRDELLAMLLR